MASKQFWYGLSIGAALLLGAIAVRFMETLHLLTQVGAERWLGVLIGLGLALYANFIPKAAPNPANWQSTLRFGGWAFCIAGLGYACLWALAPKGLAFPMATALVAIATAAVLIRVAVCTWRTN